MATQKTFVTFFSPGRHFPDKVIREVDGYDAKRAVELARSLRIKPYGFEFWTNLYSDPASDGPGGELGVESKTVDRTGMYFITGEVLLYDDIKDKTLRANMEYSQHPVVVENNNTERVVLPFTADCCIVSWHGEIVRRGNDPDLLPRQVKERRGAAC